MMLTFFINSFYNMKNILNLKERGRSSVGRYHTKQQTLILEYLALKKDTAFTAESVWRGLLGVEEKVGRATVYRALDRLVEAGTILKIPSGDGNRALYRYMGKRPSLQRADGLPGLRTGISSGVLPSRGTDPAYSERPPI
ncbi:MAG: Fur family transcriptional regulator [Flavonifractor plautii]